MASVKRHVRKTELVQPLQFLPLLLRALNGELGIIALGNDRFVDRRALLILIRRFQELDQLIEAGPGLGAHIPPNILEVYASINRFLGHYKASPILHPDAFDPRSALPHWHYRWRRINYCDDPFIELYLVEVIVKIATSGRIRSLKRCENCGKWLFARDSNNRFCSPQCREIFHRMDPADKERRNKWARNNYQLHKTKNVK